MQQTTMPHFPYTRLVFGDEQVLVVSGQHFYVLNVQTGETIFTTTALDDEAREKLNKTGPIRCAAVDTTFTHVITTGDDKKLKVWQVKDALKLLSERELPKKPTEIGFTRDGQTIVVSDKFGDVFSYPLHSDPTPAPSTSQAGASKRGSLTSHENPSNGTLILGHASMLTTYLLTPDEQYILTADRDEHIRVSWFPKGYVIERYCLGHEKFVSALHIPSFNPSVLVSGGGDPMLKIWDWMSGKLLSEVSVFDAVEPRIKVKAPKSRRGWSNEDGDADEGAAEAKAKGKGKGRRKGKGKKGAEDVREESADVEPQRDASHEQSEAPAESGGDVPMAEGDAASATAEDKAQATSGSPDDFQLVFVIHRIQTADRGERGRFIVFNAVGADAIFYAPFPAEGEKLAASVVKAVELGKPVVDFTVTRDGRIWALLDAQWDNASEAESTESAPSVRVLSWQDATLSASSDVGTPLLTSLNTKCLVPASAAELKTLDLYSALSSLPKNVDPEHDPLIRDTLSEAAAASIDGGAEGRQLTQRELGRLKKKKALLAKIQAQEQQKQASREGTAEGEADREVKRARSESASEQVAGGDAPAAGESEANVAGEPETRDVEMKES
ncbi:WD40 repeat-like protein [Trametes cingulata]|nr:WD40 repeat-like protein [Trametes cingulata]